jgi:hypothetical protein
MAIVEHPPEKNKNLLPEKNKNLLRLYRLLLISDGRSVTIFTFGFRLFYYVENKLTPDSSQTSLPVKKGGVLPQDIHSVCSISPGTDISVCEEREEFFPKTSILSVPFLLDRHLWL